MSTTANTILLVTFVFACHTDLLYHWYTITCERPIKPWIFGLYTLLALLKIMVELIKAHESPPFKKIGVWATIVLIPFVFIWLGLGAFWITGIDQEEPDCIVIHGSVITLSCVCIAIFLTVVYMLMGSVLLLLYTPTSEAFDPN